MRSYTLPQLAEELDVSRRTVRHWIAAGELRAINLSSSRSSEKPRLRILAADLEAFLAGRAVGGSSSQSARRSRRYKPKKEYV